MLEGSTPLFKILKNFPETLDVLKEFEIDVEKSVELTLAEVAIQNRIPLQIFLNHLAKKTDQEIDWLKVYGAKGGKREVFGTSSGLRTGAIPGIQKVFAVHSGKGGVGKTFVSINLAVSLASQGWKVGLVDLDIDCPNVLKILEIEGKLYTNADKKIVPFEKYGLKVISMAPALQHEHQALLWRGPVIAKAVEQLLYDTDWRDLDVLIADLPPGTGDSPVSLLNLLPIDGVVVVTTPQETSRLDAAKSIDMCKKLHVCCLGIVENMTGEIFGKASAMELAKTEHVEHFGDIELQSSYHQSPEPAVLSVLKLQVVFEKIIQAMGMKRD